MSTDVLFSEEMSDCYGYDILKKDLGERLVPHCADDFHIQKLDVKTLGLAYVSLLNQSVELFFRTSWLDCRRKCVALLDFTWEQLYTGHWKDVPITWREAYSIVSYLKALSEFALGKQNACLDFREAIKTCDMGLLMGAPVLDNILPKLASRLQQIHVQNLPEASHEREEITEEEPSAKVSKLDTPLPFKMSPDRQVLVCVEPSIEQFRSVFMESGTPVVIQGCMEYWPAMSSRRWGVPYLRRIAGWRLVPVELGSKYTEDSWSQKLMTINDFIDGYVESRRSPSSDVGYLAQHQLFDQITELKSDVIIPSYCGLGDCDDVDINAWFGPRGTVSPLHQDVKHNFLSQVVGTKYIRLYSAEHTSQVYPHGSHLLNNTSQVDVESPDLEKFPLFADLPFLECVLSPGEMLYIPPMCWHYVRSLSTSFSVSFWWK